MNPGSCSARDYALLLFLPVGSKVASGGAHQKLARSRRRDRTARRGQARISVGFWQLGADARRERNPWLCVLAIDSDPTCRRARSLFGLLPTALMPPARGDAPQAAPGARRKDRCARCSQPPRDARRQAARRSSSSSSRWPRCSLLRAPRGGAALWREALEGCRAALGSTRHAHARQHRTAARGPGRPRYGRAAAPQRSAREVLAPRTRARAPSTTWALAAPGARALDAPSRCTARRSRRGARCSAPSTRARVRDAPPAFALTARRGDARRGRAAVDARGREVLGPDPHARPSTTLGARPREGRAAAPRRSTGEVLTFVEQALGGGGRSSRARGACGLS